MLSEAARRIIEKQRRREARIELAKQAGLSEHLEARLQGYVPGDVASLGRLVEVFRAYPVASEGWRDLGRQGQALLERDVRGEARADEVDRFLERCSALLVPLAPEEVPSSRPVRIPARQVDDRLWRSPQPREPDLAQAREKGVRLVVSLREESTLSAELCPKLGLDYHWIPVPDQLTPRLEQVHEFLAVVEERGPALVHCWAGRGRTGLFVASYRIWRGAEVEEAIRLSDAEALSRGMRDGQREWVRAHAGLIATSAASGPDCPP